MITRLFNATLFVLAHLVILLVMQGCATGYSAGITHGFSQDGNDYHAPHFTVEGETVDVGVQYYRFNERNDQDFFEADWTVKWK